MSYPRKPCIREFDPEEPMKKPLLVFEDIQTTPRRSLFSFLGVEVLATPNAWLSFPCFCFLGILTACVGEPESPIVSRLALGMQLGIVLFLTNALHSLGHILGGRFLGAPVGGILLTATRNINVYITDQSLFPKRARILRALGGPLLNILVGIAGLGFSVLFSQSWLVIASYVNLGVGVWTLCPVPSMDGWVIWGEIFGFRRLSA